MATDRSQGHAFTQSEIRRIVDLLANTELNLAQIATRMQCSRSAITAINRNLKIRKYKGPGGSTKWLLSTGETVDIGMTTAERDVDPREAWRATNTFHFKK